MTRRDEWETAEEVSARLDSYSSSTDAEPMKKDGEIMTTSFDKLMAIRRLMRGNRRIDETVPEINTILNEPETNEGYVPLFLGDKIIGKIKIDQETGRFEGNLEPGLAAFLQEGLGSGMQSVSFYGQPGIPVMDAHAKFQAYLKSE